MAAQMVQKNILNGNIDRDKKTIQQDQSTKQLNEYLTVQNQLSQINSLKESQPILSRLFDYLKQLNPADPNGAELNSVMITSGDGGGTIQLQGTVANFAALDVYRTTLTLTEITYSTGGNSDSVTEPLFQTVTVNEAGLSQSGSGGGSISFTISLEYNPAAFKSDSVGVTLKIPQKTTSDADRNAPSRSVFNGQDVDTNNTTGGTDNSNGSSNQTTNSGGSNGVSN